MWAIYGRGPWGRAAAVHGSLPQIPGPEGNSQEKRCLKSKLFERREEVHGPIPSISGNQLYIG